MANQNTTKPQPVKHHRVRTFFAALFGFFAIGLIITSIIVVWLNATLTNTNQYVKTVTPIVRSQAVQKFVTTQVSDQILNGKDVPLYDFASQLLGQDEVAGKTDEQLKVAVTPIVKETIRGIVSSPSFAKLWENSNRTIHASFVSQLDSNSPTIKLNFQPVINGVIDQLTGTRLAFVKDHLQLDGNTGQIEFEGKGLDTVRRGYKYFKEATWLIVLVTLVFVILCVWLSVHHLRTIRRIALFTGLYAGILAILLSAGHLVKLPGNDPDQQQLIIALFESLTHQLSTALIVVAVIGIGGAIVSKVISMVQDRNNPSKK